MGSIRRCAQRNGTMRCGSPEQPLKPRKSLCQTSAGGHSYAGTIEGPTQTHGVEQKWKGRTSAILTNGAKTFTVSVGAAVYGGSQPVSLNSCGTPATGGSQDAAGCARTRARACTHARVGARTNTPARSFPAQAQRLAVRKGEAAASLSIGVESRGDARRRRLAALLEYTLRRSSPRRSRAQPCRTASCRSCARKRVGKFPTEVSDGSFPLVHE